MSSNYNVKTTARTSVPRSKRLREGAAPEGARSSGGIAGEGHTHSNKDDLDRLFVDGHYVQVLVDQEEESGTIAKEKVKAYAGFADNAKQWDGKEADDYIDQPVKTSSSVAFAALMVSGRRIYFGDVNHYIEIDANGNFHLSHGVWTESFVTAGGVGSGGGGGQGGISTIFFGSERYDAAPGSTAIIIPTTGNDSVKVPLGITALENTAASLNTRVTALENAPQGGVTSFGGATGAITVRGGQTANGSVNLSMSGTQLQASIVGLGNLAFKSSLAASDIPNLPASKITSGTIADARIASATAWNAKYDKPSTGIPNTDLAHSSITIAGSAISLGGSITANTIVGAATSAATFAGLAAKATQLATARNIWGQSFNGTEAISGDMSSVGKITFTPKTSAATSGYVLEVVNIGTSSNPIYALHTTLPFYSDSAITAGGVGSGGSGGGGISTIYLGTTRYDAAQGSSAIYLPAYPTQVTWANISGKPSWIGSSKPSYAFSELTSHPTTVSGYGITDIAQQAVAALATSSLSKETDIVESGLRTYNGSGSTWTGSITSMAYAAIIALGPGTGRGLQIWARRGAGNIGSLHYRVPNADNTEWASERIVIDSENYITYCAAASALSAHTSNTSNPHSVTKAQVGLGNVDNTADANKSVARAHGLTSVSITTSFDLNSALSGGGVVGNLNSVSYWVNGPSGMSYGSVAQIQSSADRGDQLALQLAWDINHNTTTPTRRLWFRASNNLGWQNDWMQIYHSGNSNKSDMAWACSTLTASGNITGALLKSTNNGNTVTIGSQNSGFCHIYNSADIPFIFNKEIQTYGGLIPFGNGSHPLGNSTHVWGDAYLTNLYASGNATIAGSLSMGDTLNMSENEVLLAASSNLYVNRGLQTRTIDFFGTNIRFRNTGNVVIGTTSSGAKLHTVTTGNVWTGLFTSDNTAVYLAHGSGPGIYIGSKINSSSSYLMQISRGQTTLGSGGTVTFYIRGDGHIGVGTNSVSEMFNVAGTIVATGNITAGSDRRWKDNISYSVGGIDIIKKLRPATWDWKEGHGKGKGAGLIAQDVMAVLPYVVQGSGKDGYTLNYNVFHAFEISALQQHENEIDRLRRKVAELERRLNIN